MRKIMFLAIMFAFVSSVNAQTKEVVLNPGERANIITTPCPVEPFQGSNQMFKQLPPKNRIIWKQSPRPVCNTNINSNNTTFIVNNVTNEVQPEKKGDGSFWYYSDGNGWLVPLLAILMIGGLIAAMIYFSKHHASLPPPPPAPRQVLVIGIPQPAQKVEPVKSNPYTGMDEARADAKATGAIFRVYDNGYKVEFPKPAEGKKEN